MFECEVEPRANKRKYRTCRAGAEWCVRNGASSLQRPSTTTSHLGLLPPPCIAPAADIGYAGVLIGLSGGTAIGLPPVIKYGTEDQKRRWLPGISTGETSFCLGATEPSGV